jgi:hypothetical protein
LFTAECTECLIWNPDNSSWVQNISTSGSVPSTLEVKFDENFGQAVIYVNLNFFPGIAREDVLIVNEGAPIVTAATITGDNYLANCLGAVNTYNLTNVATNWSADDWTVTSLSTSNETSSSVMVSTANTSSYGSATLTAEMVYIRQGIVCGTQNITKSIYYGKPTYHSQKIDGNYYYPGSSICPGTHWAGIQWNGSPSSYSWNVPSGITYTSSLNELDFYLTSSSGISFSVNASNICGTSFNASYYLSSCGGGYMLSLYPNPSSTEININIDYAEKAESADIEQSLFTKNMAISDEIIFNVNIYDDKKNLVYEKSSITSPYLVDTKSFKAGIYILTIVIGEDVLKEQIVIN